MVRSTREVCSSVKMRRKVPKREWWNDVVKGAEDWKTSGIVP